MAEYEYLQKGMITIRTLSIGWYILKQCCLKAGPNTI